MRVAFITHYGDYQYGANRSLVDLIDGLRAYGVEMLVIAPRAGSLVKVLERRGIAVHYRHYGWWMSPGGSKLRASARMLRGALSAVPLARQLKSWNCDIIHSNSSVTPMGWLLAAVTRRPHVWHIREFGDRDYELQHDLGTQLFRKGMASAAAKVTVSRAILTQVLPGRLASGAHVVYNGVAFRKDFDRLQKQGGLRHGAAASFTFCILGLISPVKGQVEAIRAFARVAAKHENVSLVVAGSGQEEDVRSCAALVDRLGLRSKVKFTGYVDDPFPLLTQADAILVCSKVEAMGRITVEAMAAGKPVISYVNEGALELIEHEVNGLLYSSGAEELANYMLRLIEDQSLSSRIALAGWEGARGKYTIEKYAGTIHDIYRSILQDYPRKQGLARA